MIDERKLLEKINDYCSEFDESLEENKSFDGYNIKSICMSVIAEILDLIQDQPKVGEWIPVEERLPEKETYVLCYVPKVDGNVQYGIYVGRRLKIKADDGSGNFWGIPTKECDWSLKGWSYIDHPTIVAWQPLPEPFKGD